MSPRGTHAILSRAVMNLNTQLEHRDQGVRKISPSSSGHGPSWPDWPFEAGATDQFPRHKRSANTSARHETSERVSICLRGRPSLRWSLIRLVSPELLTYHPERRANVEVTDGRKGRSLDAAGGQRNVVGTMIWFTSPINGHLSSVTRQPIAQMVTTARDLFAPTWVVYDFGLPAVTWSLIAVESALPSLPRAWERRWSDHVRWTCSRGGI